MSDVSVSIKAVMGDDMKRSVVRNGPTMVALACARHINRMESCGPLIYTKNTSNF
jgi:hypothetical protein